MENKKNIIDLVCWEKSLRVKTSYAIGLIFLIFLILFTGCSSQSNIFSKAKSAKNINYQKRKDNFKDFVLKGVEEGKKVWQISGDTAFFNLETSEKVDINNLEVFFYENNVVTARVKALKGEVNTKTKDMHAIGKVEIFSFKDDIKLFTEEIFFINLNSTFFSNKFVRIERGNGAITEGIGFNAKSDLSEINIKKNVVIKYKKFV